MTSPETVRCATHPDVATNLRCGKCGKPICPRCLVQTPVGARCRDCAKLYRLPTYRLAATDYLKAAGTALGVAIVVGLAWGFITNLVSFIYLNLLLAAGAGYAIGEVTGLAVNRKRGPWLAAVGGIAVVIGYMVNIFVFGEIPSIGLSLIIDLTGIGVGIYMAVNRLH
jgi:hypothetical protein